jgi:hypothetical protein
VSAVVTPNAPAPTYEASVEALRTTQTQADKWRLADALLADVPQGESRTGFNGVIAAAEAAQVKPLKMDTLRQYRDTAAKFPPEVRVPGVSFTAHRIAMRMSAKGLDAVKTLQDLAAVQGAENVSCADVEDVYKALNPAPIVVEPTGTAADASTGAVASILAQRFNTNTRATVTEITAAGSNVVAALRALADALETREANTSRKANAWGASTAKAKTPATQVAADGAPLLGNVRG